MASSFVLPLCPLAGVVLLPGADLRLRLGASRVQTLVGQASGYGGAVIVSLADGDAVHEVGVTALVSEDEDQAAALHGVTRCRLLDLVEGATSLVRAERYPDTLVGDRRAEALGRLLLARYNRLCRSLALSSTTPRPTDGLSAITWRIVGELGLSPDQQQGFLNVADPLTRGRLLLVTLRELQRRERFLRPWGHLRGGAEWN
jgi:Lon protease-like protein